ncbi:MAG: MFS transporter [Chloroflexi bacterium]|nr:MFS transporter [Chloroflexota bacterium]
MTAQSSKNGGYRWVILVVASLIQAIVSMSVFSFGPLAPFLRDAFDITRVQLGVFASLFALSSMFVSVPGGWLVDRFGIRKLLLLGPGAFGLFFVLFSRVPDISTGYVMVFLAGLGNAFVTPVTTVALVHWFSVNSRATAVSLKQSGLTIGTAAGAVMVPTLALSLGWRDTVAILGAISVAVAIASFAIYRRPASQPSTGRLPALSTLRQVMGNKRLLRLGMAGSVFIGLQFCVSSYLVLQMVEVRQLSAVIAGTFLMTVNLGGTFGRILWGTLSDRSFRGQRRPVLLMVTTISGITALVLSAASDTMPWWLLYLTVGVLGLSGFGFNGVYLTFATEISGQETAATGLGWVVTVHAVGVLFGPPLFGYIVDSTSSYNPAWLVFGILTVVASLSLMFIREHKPVIAQT